MSPAVLLEAAGAEDLGALLALERESYTNPWNLRAFRGALAAAGGLALVLRSPHEPADPARGIQAYCMAQLVLDELHVHNLVVRQAARGRGLARRLLGLVLGLAARRGARVALLEVRQSNGPALQLYRSLGFAVVGSRKGYYERPAEDAVLLRKDGLLASG